MKQIPAAFWTTIGWISLLLLAYALVLTTIDGVMAYFAISLAMIVGGVSSIGESATIKYAVSTAAVGAASVFGMTHYIVSTGFQLPSLESFKTLFTMTCIPLAVSGAMLLLGIHRRKKLPASTVQSSEI
jgi:hypothetical protein